MIDIIGDVAYAWLRDGAYLHRWSRTVPTNWWIEEDDGKMIWHSEHGEHPSLSDFKLVKTEYNGDYRVYRLKESK